MKTSLVPVPNKSLTEITHNTIIVYLAHCIQCHSVIKIGMALILNRIISS